ncbi:unnamed protein product, partial [Heterotrigona itama]
NSGLKILQRHLTINDFKCTLCWDFKTLLFIVKVKVPTKFHEVSTGRERAPLTEEEEEEEEEEGFAFAALPDLPRHLVKHAHV